MNIYYIGPREKLELAIPGCMDQDDTRTLPDGRVLVELKVATMKVDLKAIKDEEITELDHAGVIRALTALRHPEEQPVERPKRRGRSTDETL